MKTNLQFRKLVIAAILVLVTFVVSAQSTDQPEKKKHVKLVKVENGKKTVVDTLLAGYGSDMEWVEELDSTLNEKLKRIKIEVEDDGEHQNVLFISDDEDSPMSWNVESDVNVETIVDGDSVTKVIMIKHADKPRKHEMMMHHDPHFVSVPKPPHPPMRTVWIGKHPDDKMIIHLDDPNIISYKKKDLSGGREKIEIIREKPSEENVEEIIELKE